MLVSAFKKFLQSWLAPVPYIESSHTLEGSIILVTGGGSGIGKAIVELVNKRGATAIILDRAKNPKGVTSKTTHPVDVTDYQSVDSTIAKIYNEFGRIDALINCAGIFADKKLLDSGIQEFRQVIEVNLLGTVNTTRAVLPYMVKQKVGAIINIGSKISHNTNVDPGKVAYATSKYAVEGFSFALNKELKGSGVRVTCLMPGTVATFLSKENHSYLTPHDIAGVVAFVLESKNLDIESLVVKSTRQNI